MEYLVLVLAMVIGAIGRRGMGRGREPDDPWYLKIFERQVAIAFIAVGVAIPVIYFFSPALFAAQILPYLGVVLLTAQYTMGHGSYFDFGTSGKPDNELTGKILLFWWKDDGKNKFRDTVGMFLRYSFWPLFGFLCLFNPVIAIILSVVSGLVVAAAYRLGFENQDKLPHTRWLDGYTAYGEVVMGLVIPALVWIGFIIG